MANPDSDAMVDHPTYAGDRRPRRDDSFQTHEHMSWQDQDAFPLSRFEGQSILIVDDDPDFLNLLELRCRNVGFNVITARDGISALNAAESFRPDVICIDAILPGANGVATAQMLISDPRLDPVPIVVISGLQDREIRQQCAKLPAHFVAKCETTWQELESLLEDLFPLSSHLASDPPPQPDPLGDYDSAPSDESDQRTASILDAVYALIGDPISADDSRSQDKPWVLCIDDDYDFSRLLAIRLQAKEISVINAFDGLDGVKTAMTQPANAIVLDYNMPNGRGDEVLRHLKQSPITQDIPVIVLTGNKNGDVQQSMLNLGADAFFHKPPDFDEVVQAIFDLTRTKD